MAHVLHYNRVKFQKDFFSLLLRSVHQHGCCDVRGKPSIIDLFADTAATLISIVSNSYYGMPRGQIHINLPPEYPIMSFGTI